MKSRVLAIVLTLFTCHLYAADYYWVGGGGNWSELSHWRLGSPTGSIPSIVPSTADNVFFGAYSGFGTTTASKTVTLDANGYCKTMTWEAGVANNPRFIMNSSTLRVEVSGNLVLSPSTTYSVTLSFTGPTAATLKTNGPVLGSIDLEINKPGGGVTVTDSLVTSGATGNNVTLTEGTFDVSGKKWIGTNFTSNNDKSRILEITNSPINLTSFDCRGQNKTVNAVGSTLFTAAVLITDGGTYHIVSNGGGSAGWHHNIQNTIFSSLTFTWPGTSSAAWIGNNNTILDSLRFMGQGRIDNNNTVGRLYFNGNGTIGIGNTIRYIKNAANFTVGAGVNNVDSLLLASSSIVNFKGTFNLNKYMHLAGQSCDAYTEVNGDSTSGTLNFATGATVDINNMILTGVKATGNVTPITVSGIDGGGNSGFTINAPASGGTTLYWVGGPGNWNDRNHWSTSSGGAPGACVPFIGDDVVFDANSGLASGTVTTTSSSFCRNMTWTGVGNVTFNESATSRFNIYGSLVMDNSVAMNAVFEFVGTAAATITTNGNTLGSPSFRVLKTGAGVVTLNDNWNYPLSTIEFLSGGLNLSGRTVNIYTFNGLSNTSRTLNISNAKITVGYYWDLRGLGKSMDATGSYIICYGGFGSNLNMVYDKVDIAGSGGAGIGFPFTDNTFGQLTYTYSAITGVFLPANNTVRRLEFKSNGSVGADCVIDSLVLTGSRVYGFQNIKINKYIKAESDPCSGLLEMRGTGTITFADGVEFHMNNIYMQNLTAVGSMTPIAFNGADAGGNTGWKINVAPGGNRYWVGGSGDWNDPMHWSATSGGAPGSACVPTVYDNVFFDAGSGFTSASKTVSIATTNAYCSNISWAGALNNPIFNKAGNVRMEVWGDNIVLNPATSLNFTSLVVKGSNATTISGAAPAGDFDIEVDKAPGGSVTLLNDYSNTLTTFYVMNGELNLSGRTLNIASIDNDPDGNNITGNTTVNISNANITTGTWRYISATSTSALNTTNSTLNTTTFLANSNLTYNNVNIRGNATANVNMNNLIIDSLVFTNNSTSSTVGINGANNNLNYVEYKGSGGIYGTGNTIDTLVFFPGSRYVLNSGTNTTITGEWYGSGTPCRLTEVVSSGATNATVTKTSGDVTFDYVRLQRITGTGGATYSTKQHSINQGGNTGWTMAPYDGAAPIYGLGPDTAVAPADFPIVLRTDGFFGAPSSQYTWNDNSKADTLLVTQPGTYSVQVNFVDGCSISDAITVSQASTLPITLGRFTLRLQENCSSVQLNWNTSSEQNSKDFTIQRSINGTNWTPIGTVAAAGHSNVLVNYSFTDGAIGDNDTYYYRLQMNDIDGRQKNSPMVTVKLNCGSGKYLVYPNPVRDFITIQSPAGGGQKLLSVYNATGQRIMQANLTPGSVQTITTSGWNKGVYMLVVSDSGKQVYTQQLIRQ